jgi:3-hydroxybutyryl-CoA dehydratase
MKNAFEEIKIGDVIQGPVMEVTEEKIRDFAEASLDYNALHLDDQFMEKSFGKTKFKGIIAHGMMNFSLITRTFTDWLWPLGGVHRRLETRWLKPVYPGDVITSWVTINQKLKTEKGRWILSTVEVRNQSGQVVATGEAMAEFPETEKTQRRDP